MEDRIPTDTYDFNGLSKEEYPCDKVGCENRYFATAYNLQRRIQSQHSKKHWCHYEDCGEVFESKLALSKHMNKVYKK